MKDRSRPREESIRAEKSCNRSRGDKHMRRVDVCMNCRDEREIVAHGLCAKCYMRDKRGDETADSPLGLVTDRSQRRFIADRNKMLTNLVRIVKLLDETPCIDHEDVTTIKAIIQPYLLERATAPTPKKPGTAVNTKSESSVDSNGQADDAAPNDAAELTVNTDFELTVNSDLGPDPDTQPPKPKKGRSSTGTTYKSRKVNAIGWCEDTWNVVVGCSRVSDGCQNCYAIPQVRRMSGNPNFGDPNPYKELVQIKNGKLDFTGKVKLFEERLQKPLRVNRPTTWFVNSLSDIYYHSLALDDIKRIFDVMNKARRHTFQILTKRAERMLEVADELEWTPNIWQGVTFEGIPADMPAGQRAKVLTRIPNLVRHPAQVKFISFEPLIGPIPPDTDLSGIDWAFFGGESHLSPSKARTMDFKWLRDGIALCEAQGVKPHVKQLGSAWAIASGTNRPPKGADKKLVGKYRMGKIAEVWPPDLRPYAIDPRREVTPEALAESLLGTRAGEEELAAKGECS